MVSAQHIALHGTGRIPGMQGMLGTEELPETGAFDFFNYLLGLQANPTEQLDGEQATKASLFGSKSNKEGETDPLLALFNKKEPNAWNLMFPTVGNVGTQNNQPIVNINTKGAETSLLENKNVEVTGNPNDQLNQKSLDTLMQEPKNFLSLEALRPEQGAPQFGSNELGAETPGVLNAQRDFALQKYNQQVNDQEVANDPKQDVRTQMVQKPTGNTEAPVTSHVATHVATANEAPTVESKGKKRSGDSTDNLFALGKAGATADNQMNVEADMQTSTHTKDKAETIPEVFKKVESMVHHGGGKMTVQLSPPELGKVEIHVATRGNQVEIKMKSDNDFAKATLESHLGELKTSMHGQDLQLNKVEVQVTQDWDRSFQGGQFAAFSGNQGERQNNTGGERGNWNSREQFTSTQSRSSQSIQARNAFGSSGSSRGGVDIRI